jgi:hypothetical protein
MAGNVFQEVLTDASNVKERLLGPDYPYYKNIKDPSSIGMSSKGNLKALSKDVNGLIAYVEVLVSGKSKASATGRPLGNKFFLQTAAKCKAIDNENEEVSRYIYVDNVPYGNIPIISSGLDTNFSDFKGLIPGTMSNLNVLNPFTIMSAFLAGSKPDCQQITMETIDSYNNKSTETHYVTTVDIQNMDPCIFPNKKNPITHKKCKETFDVRMPQDILTQLYYLSLMVFVVFIIYKMMNVKK